MGKGPDEGIELSKEIEDQLLAAINDLGTSVENYSVAYQNVNGLVDLLGYLKEDLTTLKNYTSSVSVGNSTLDKYGNIDVDYERLKKDVDGHYENLTTLNALYISVYETLSTMFVAVQKVLADGDGVDIVKLLKDGKLSELFDKNAVYMSPKLEEILEGMGKDISKKLAVNEGKALFGAVFGAIFGNTISNVLGDVVVGGLTGEINIDWTNFSIASMKDVFKLGISSVATDMAAGKVSESGFFATFFKDAQAKELSLTGQTVIGGLAGFSVTFLANLATAWFKDKDLSPEDVGDAAVTAGISTLSFLIVDAVMTASGLGAIGGPPGVAIAACGAAAASLMSYGGKKFYEWLKYHCTHYGDGVPKKYEHMTNKEILAILNEAGYHFDVPKYGEYSAYDIANTLAKKGASPELIAFVEAGAGGYASVGTLFQDGNYDAKTQAIIDFFSQPVIYDDWTDETFRSNNPQSDKYYDGYAEEYNEQIRELRELFGNTDDKGLQKYNDYAHDNVSVIMESEIIDNIVDKAKEQGILPEDEE